MKYKLLILVFLLTNCSVVARVAFGIKKPKARSADYIQKHADKYQLNHFKHYSISDKGFMDFFEQPERLPVKNSVNSVIIFNEKGKLILPKDSIDCTSDISNYISHYNKSDYNIVFDTIEFRDVFGSSISSLHGNTSDFSQTNGKSLFVITWASFTGKLNKNFTKPWADSIKNIINLNNADAIFLSFDFRENWDFEKYRPE